MADTIEFETYASVQIAVGRITDVQEFPRARQPSYKVFIDLGDLGTRQSSAQITNYAMDDLVGRQVVCVVNLAPRNIAGFQSEVLILGARNTDGDVIILSPEVEVPLGAAVF
ncbi:tRNA-binding protein [Gymnodinialimonas sp. 2305UL16-5]|uniref:tRNA-binding protein n=1 Tax=Gymnodinialimonas mytili TaxID=3126503 RepID=UPI0030B4C37E